MDMNFLMMNQLGVMPLNQNGISTESLGDVEPGFGNLLDLVDSLEVAELSSATDSEMNWEKMMANLGNEEEKKLLSEKMMALANLNVADTTQNTPIESLAQFKSIPQVGDEVQNEFGRESVQLKVLPENYSDMSLGDFKSSVMTVEQQNRLKNPQLSETSVASWASAISSDELKSVELGNELSVPEKLFQVERSKQNVEGEILQGQLVASVKAQNQDKVIPGNNSLKKVSSKEAVSDIKSEVKNEIKAEQAISKQGNEVLSKAQESPRLVDANVRANKNEIHQESGFVKHVPEKVTSSANVLNLNDRENSMADNSKGKEKKQTEPQSAKDFILDRSAPLSAETTKQISNSPANTESNSKVDSAVMDFVADKVKSLQDQGGGTIKIGLETKDAGMLQIKVSIRNGQLDVRIDGSDQRLTRELSSKKGELLSKLEKTADVTSLEIGGDLKSSIVSRSQSADIQRASYTTEDMIKNLSGIEIADSNVGNSRSGDRESHLSIARTEDANMTSMKDEGFERQEKRQKAMSQWEDFSERLKQSA